MPAFVEGRILYDQGQFDEAWMQFEGALAASRKPGATPIPELHYYAGDTLTRLDRRSDAEAEFVSELRLFPHNVRARAGLATLYHVGGQTDAADDLVTDMLRITPTQESYLAASRLLKAFGKPKQADAIRAQARTFAAPRR
jgi:tetratricopeptide (TPR) repeat protein